MPLLEVKALSAAYGLVPALHRVDFHVEPGEVVGILGHNGMGKTTLMRAIMGFVKVTGGDIRFEGVGFAYDSGRPILSNIDLEIRAGETVAFVGPSGAGKTTLLALLPRFYEPTSGRITVDGIALDRMQLHSLRRQIGLVSQDVFLFGGTLRENIAYGRLGASEEEIMQAARQAQLGPLIDPEFHACGSVEPHGERVLAHPETNIYIVGIESYGRAPTFLMATGYEQVRSIAAALAGDRKAADAVHLELPETGVCTTDLGGSCDAPAPAGDACCGSPQLTELSVGR